MLAETVIKEARIGREEITTSIANIATEDDLMNVFSSALTIHNRNVKKIQMLEDYYCGVHSILGRIKAIRPDINNKVVRNLPYAIVEFKKGYEFGNPIQYIQKKGKIEPDPETLSADNKVTGLNDVMSLADKKTKDLELAENLFISGVGYRGIFPNKDVEDIDEAPFYLDTLNPKNAFVVKNNGIGKKVVLACMKVEDTQRKISKWGCYTKDLYFEIDGSNDIKRAANPLGMIPIIQYRLNPRMIGSFEAALSEIDALNTQLSNRIDAIEQIVQAILVFENCDIDNNDLKELREKLAIKVKGDVGVPAAVKYITADLNQDQVQTSIDDSHQNILAICNVPDRNASAGGNTGAALQVAEGWAGAEAQAKSDIAMFEEAERSMLRVAKKIIDTTSLDYACKGIKISDIDINADREKNQNLLTKTQGLLNLLEAGIDPATACASVGLFNDPQLVADKSPNMEKWKTETRSTVAEVTNATTEDTANNPNNASF